MNNTLFVQALPFTLAGSGAVLGDTSIILASFTQINGTLLTMSNFGVKGYGTIAPGSAQELPITFTGVVQNGNGTATLTGVHSQLTVSPYTETSGLTESYSGGSIFVISNTAGFYDALDAKDNDETILGTYTFTNPNYPRMDTATPAPVDDEQLATKKYVDDTAIAGAPLASATVFGITKLSSNPSNPANPVALNAEEVSVTSISDGVPRANNDGYLDASYGGVDGSFATLNGLVKVIQDPANATATATPNKIPIADGSAHLNTWIDGSTLTNIPRLQLTMTAGEALTAGNAVIVGAAEPVLTVSQPADNDDSTLTNTTWIGQTFTTSTKAKFIKKVTAYLSDGGGGTECTMSIRATSLGLPTGADISGFTAVANSAGLASTITFTFASAVPVSPSTVYAIVMRRSGTDPTDGVDWRRQNTNVYPNGQTVNSANSGSTWAAGTGDQRFSVFEIQTTAGQVYQASALQNDEYANKFIGFAVTNISASATGLITVTGVDNNQSALSTAQTYFLADTFGAISTSAGTNSRKVGLSLSATQILIKHDNV